MNTSKRADKNGSRRQSYAMEDVTYANPYLNKPTKRFETYVEVGSDVAVVHKGVVYHVKHDADTETIILASNHRWRSGLLMVVISPRDITAKEAHKLINDYLDRYIWCHICRRDAVGLISYRIDVDLKTKSGKVVCAYCDPTVDFIAGFFDSLERGQGDNDARGEA